MNLTLIILLIYLVLLFFVAWFFSRQESLDAYFLNSKKTGLWLMVFASIATMLGAGSTVAMVSEIYNSGISYGIALPIGAILGVILLGIIAKKIKIAGDKYEAYTLVDFFHKRFDNKNKIIAFFFQIFLMISWIGVQAIAIASLTSVLIGINFNMALFLAAGVTILYTAIGGLKIDFITDFIQFWIILLVFSIMAIIGYQEIGSISSLLSSVPKGHLNPFAFGGIVWLLGVILLSGFVYIGDSATWQRIVSVKNQKTARKAFFLTIPFFLFLSLVTIFFGLIASVKLTGISQDLALFSFMKAILPPWLLGLGFASILAVIMSTIDSGLIGGSTIIYRAIFKKDQFENKKELFYARLITALFGVCGFSIAFLFPNIVSLSLFSSYLAVTFAIPLVFGLYSKKISANASFYALIFSTISLIITFPIIGPNCFVIPLILSLSTLLFYDKIFKRKDILNPKI